MVGKGLKEDLLSRHFWNVHLKGSRMADQGGDATVCKVGEGEWKVRRRGVEGAATFKAAAGGERPREPDADFTST